MPAKSEINRICFLATLLLLLLPSISFAQFSSQNYEGTYNLKPGQVELTPNYTFNYFPPNISLYDYANNIGLSARVGLHKQIDIKADYNWLFSTYGDNIWHVVQVGPRFSNKNGRIAFRLPLGIVFDRKQHISEGSANFDVNYFVSARMMFGAVKKKYFELMISPMGELFISDENLILAGLDLGFGFSNDFSRWSIRPEGTILVDPQNTNDFIWKVGISFSATIGGRTKYDHPDKYDVPLYMK